MKSEPASMRTWLAHPLPPDVALALQRLAGTPDVVHIAVMPDVHLASEICVGTVVATAGMVLPNAIGGDIGCGMLALAFDTSADVLRDRTAAAQVLSALYEYVPIRRHHPRTAPAFPSALADMPLSHPRLESLKKSDARSQLGTLGSGNHFVELQAQCGTDQLWLMIHSGSRNIGQQILHQHLPATHKTATGLAALDAASPAGQAYLADIQWARDYATANRRAMAHAVARALEATLHATPLMETLYDCDHNHLRVEEHFGQTLFVHRKGATAAQSNQPGIIPGSMATHSFHTTGRGLPESLCSSSHGAGRALSRHQAREKISASVVRQQLKNVWYDHRNTPALREEAPGAYKDIDAVMRAQQDLTSITRKLTPVLSYKGS
jgi:tRNA-splicing ligase RtcB (3'-phosphate/5'-hydroxy nucleic acid ligase)